MLPPALLSKRPCWRSGRYFTVSQLVRSQPSPEPWTLGFSSTQLTDGMHVLHVCLRLIYQHSDYRNRGLRAADVPEPGRALGISTLAVVVAVANLQGVVHADQDLRRHPRSLRPVARTAASSIHQANRQETLLLHILEVLRGSPSQSAPSCTPRPTPPVPGRRTLPPAWRPTPWPGHPQCPGSCTSWCRWAQCRLS